VMEDGIYWKEKEEENKGIVRSVEMRRGRG
jgi:hypothetical protein